MSLREKVDVLCVQLGLDPGMTIVDVIHEAARQLAVSPGDKALVQLADECCAVLGVSATEAAAPVLLGQVVATGQPVTHPIPPVVVEVVPMPITAPQVQQMDRTWDGSGAHHPIAGRAGPLRLTLNSHPGRALRLEGDCCLPFPPPVFVCCLSGIVLGQEHQAMTVVYDPRSGRLLRPEACNQRIHISWENFVPGNEVLSFHCGIFDCHHNEAWTLYSDGTIHSRQHRELVLGARGGDGKLILVSEGDHTRRLVFTEVLAQS